MQRDRAVNVSLTPELNRFVEKKLKSGRYGSASEVVREALRLLEDYDRTRVARLAAFNGELGARLSALDRGEHTSPRVARQRIARRSTERRKLRA